MRDGRAEGLIAGGDRGQNTTPVTPDFDGTHVCIFEISQLEGRGLIGQRNSFDTGSQQKVGDPGSQKNTIH